VGVTSCAVGILLFVGSSLQGCGVLPRREPVAPAFTRHAVALNIPESRYWPNLDLVSFFQGAIDSTDRERAFLAENHEPIEHLPPAYYLALSGGGDNGAFGAGVLVGWSKAGDRPQFKVVTGISAGALLAPFAFLGPDYDKVLSGVFSSLGPKDILHFRNILTAISRDAFADDSPLASTIAKYVTSDLLDAIALQYSRGRVLLIGTTDLDSGQPVVWNMGAIASSKYPGALELFRQVILASASIPGVFPPVMIDVKVDGKLFQEMHVDGGVTTQVFLFPPLFVRGLTANRPINERERHVYIIRNGRMVLPWQSVARRTTSVGRRAINALIESQSLNDLYRLEVAARAQDEDFNITYIGAEFNYPHNSLFASDYMRHLFEYGYERASNGHAWRKTLPSDVVSPDDHADQSTIQCSVSKQRPR
jgi:predicted acylesterase/phospholipase RssA